MLKEEIVCNNDDLSIDDKPGSIGMQHILNTIYRSTSKEYAITCSGQFVLLDVKDNEFFDDYPKYNLEETFEEQALDVKIFLANIIVGRD